MQVAELLADLRLNRNFMRQVVAWERLPARTAAYGEWSADLHPQLRAALTDAGATRPFRHQVAAIEAARSGSNVVIATGTASGKSLCYTVPVCQRMLERPKARALYLFPTKALAQDQLAATLNLIGAANLPLEAHVYDGDTPKSRRRAVRQGNGIVITNPDMLHAGILPYHTQWRSLFSQLEFIVVDEIHTYRGVFGSHVANVLRRLLRICSFYGSAPQFICCSATIANPQSHAERLCGAAPFHLIDERQNGAPHGEKHIILYNPPVFDEALGLRQSVLITAMEVATEFLRHDIQTAVFARSRQGVEVLLGYLQDQLSLQRDEDASAAVRGYRSGYLPLERRDIERGLRRGAVLGVVATNALELGVDIGALDAAVLSGYPGSIASLWQQAGRAGRRDAPSAAVLIAGNSPLDQYLCRHPHYLFGRSPESALINPDNPRIMLQHIQSAAFEIPFAQGEPWGAFGPVDELLDVLSDEGTMHKTRGNYHWIGDGTPQHAFSLRTSGSENVVIHADPDPYSQGEDVRPRVIAEVDLDSAPLMVHEGAIYSHQAETFLVESLDWDARIARARPALVDYYTRANLNSDVRELQPFEETHGADLYRACGDVLVVSQATSYKKIKRYSHETLGYGRIELPPMELDTTGTWLVFGDALAEKLFDLGILLRPNDYGPNWPEQRRRALERDGFRCRTCGAMENLHVHHIHPFREYDHPDVANRLENLATLCPACHRLAEAGVQQRSAMAGLATVLRNLAPLFLMCDVTDLHVVAETRHPLTKGPTIVMYESVPAGVGLAERLYELHDALLAAALELVADCNCRDGCPACVGPPGEIGVDTKWATRRLLEILVGRDDVGR